MRTSTDRNVEIRRAGISVRVYIPSDRCATLGVKRINVKVPIVS